MKILRIKLFQIFLLGGACFGAGMLTMRKWDENREIRVIVPGGPYGRNLDSDLGIATMLAKSYPDAELVYWHNDTRASGLICLMLARLEVSADSETYALCYHPPLHLSKLDIVIDGKAVDLKERMYFPYEGGRMQANGASEVIYDNSPVVWRFSLKRTSTCRIVLAELTRTIYRVGTLKAKNSVSEDSERSLRNRIKWGWSFQDQIEEVTSEDSAELRTISLERIPPLDWISELAK